MPAGSSRCVATMAAAMPRLASVVNVSTSPAQSSRLLRSSAAIRASTHAS